MHNWKAKKLLALLLSIVMVLGLLPMSALAADTTETADAPITVTAGGKACALEKLEDETYTIYRAVFYPEQDITIAPAGSTGTVSLFGPSGNMPIYDADNNPMENLSSATLPASMITSNALPDDQITALPGYKELPGGYIAYSYIIVSVNGGAPFALHLAVVEQPADASVTSIKITRAPTKTVYTAGESFDKTGMTVAAVYDNDTEAAITDFTVEGGESLTATTTKVTVKSGNCSAEQPITVLPASSAYELRVLTFEDADYKGGTNFAGGNDWTSLIDDPQYGGKLLYG